MGYARLFCTYVIQDLTLTKTKACQLMEDQKKLDALLVEFQRVSEEIVSMQRKSESLMGYGLTIAGFSMVYLYLKEPGPGYGLLPVFLLLGLFHYFIVNYIVVMSLGGYKRYVEETLDSVIGAKLLVWERQIAPDLLHNSLAMRSLWIVLAIVPITSLLFGFRDFLDFWSDHQWIASAAACMIVIMVFLISWSLKSLLEASEKAYLKATKLE